MLFPDLYEIGMSYMGLQILYNILNKEDEIYCERVFAPAQDMSALMREEKLDLFTLETKTSVRDMDCSRLYASVRDVIHEHTRYVKSCRDYI